MNKWLPRVPFTGTSVRSRLLAINALLLLAQGTVSALAWHGVSVQKDAMSELALISRAARYHQDADAVRANVRADVYAAVAGPSLSDEGDRTALLREHTSDLRKDLRTLEQMSLPADLADSLSKVEMVADDFVAQAAEVVAALADGAGSSGGHIAEFVATSESLGLAMDQQTSVLAARIVAANERAELAATNAKLWLVVASVVTTLLVAALVAVVSASIRRSLQRVGLVAKQIAGGNLDVRSQENGDGEIGHLSTSINQMADSLHEVIGQLRGDAEHQSFNRALADALEAADNEPAAYEVVARAMQIASATLPAELLIADSSRTHLERASEHPVAGAPGCKVESPYDCLAVRRGSTQRFPDSDALNACAHLQGRPCGRVTAVCVPLSFMGRALGVLHAAAPTEDAPTAVQIDKLSAVGSQSAARIGTVRAFERTQLQASTDTLTGLGNRRAANEKLRTLSRAGGVYAFVLCDLDHFKKLNDRHGHEMGDAALRAFGDLLRRAIRGNDMAARWGGEEFALILPGASVATAIDAASRVREGLRVTTASGSVPPFTASFGIADSLMSRDVAGLARLADAALYAAKDAGRDRWIVADPTNSSGPGLRHATESAAAIDAAMLDSGIFDVLTPNRPLGEPAADQNDPTPAVARRR